MVLCTSQVIARRRIGHPDHGGIRAGIGAVITEEISIVVEKTFQEILPRNDIWSTCDDPEIALWRHRILSDIAYYPYIVK